MPRFADQRKIAGRDGVMINVAVEGQGPPLLLLHGYPQTMAMWHRLVPALAQHFTCILPDLRGYGASDKPRGDASHMTYAKRTMAADMIAVMDALGHDRFDVVGHDRGARVTHRLCLDHAARVKRVALLDIVPTLDVYERANQLLARIYFHWFFLIQAEPLPENLLAGDPALWVKRFLGGLGDGLKAFDPEAVEAYIDAFRDPRTIHATCEDYRAGASIDLDHDRADRAVQAKITAPCLILWGKRGALPHLYDVMALWRAQAEQVTGMEIDSGHFLPEQAPEATLQALLVHFRADGP